MAFHLYTRKEGDEFVLAPTPFPTYESAVRFGQTTVGKGHFFVEGDEGFVPSESIQLLEPQPNPETRASRRKQLLESL